MPLNRGTQKQIAQRFKGNLDYFRKAHYWRRLRFWTILLVSLVGFGAMAFFYFRGPESMYNPGSISQHHAKFAHDCAQCHEPPKKSLAGATVKLTNAGIDERCEKCHIRHSFHQPNVVTERACTVCHQEHEGSGPMAAPSDAQCGKCHADAPEMAASAAKGKTLAASAFDYRPETGWNIFRTPRPPAGFTAVINSFATDHPEFRVVADKLRETNTLKFNHKRHLFETNDIPQVGGGKRLDCTYCHQPGPGGSFFQRISFDRHCRSCHSLQFDDRTPELRIPHGRAEHVRAFLRSLPTHYAELARRTSSTQAEVDDFVSRQWARLREQFVDGTNLEREVFFSLLRKMPDGRTKFDGCATCHQVTDNSYSVPVITPVAMPDRWMVHAQFHHGKHASVACVKCHDATKSADTADVIMPGKASCVECHSPQGKVASNCSFCHTYHPPLHKDELRTQLR